MKRTFVTVCAALMFSSLTFAEKPEWAGKGKPTAEQKEAHRAAMQAKGDDIDDAEEAFEKEKEKNKDKLKGLEKQKEKKAGQIQKELDKGSDQGIESRQQRKKWWKFWGE